MGLAANLSKLSLRSLGSWNGLPLAFRRKCISVRDDMRLHVVNAVLLGGLYQIPPDLVVKRQDLDIAEIIL